MTIQGTFKQRGYNGSQSLESLRDFAQTHFITDIMTVGESARDMVYVVAYTNQDGTTGLHQVKGWFYDFMAFTSDEDLKAYNNMTDRVRKHLGAYTNIKQG